MMIEIYQRANSFDNYYLIYPKEEHFTKEKKFEALMKKYPHDIVRVLLDTDLLLIDRLDTELLNYDL